MPKMIVCKTLEEARAAWDAKVAWASTSRGDWIPQSALRQDYHERSFGPAGPWEIEVQRGWWAIAVEDDNEEQEESV